MSRDVALPPGPRWWRPWPVLFCGIGLELLGLVMEHSWDFSTPLRVLLLFAGVLLAGVAVNLRLKSAREEFEERAESAGLVALAGFTALLAYWGMDEKWVSGHRVFGGLAIAAVTGAIILLFAGVARRVVLSVLLLYHFGGIVTAITMIAPPGSNAVAPYLPTQAWIYLYRPYLGMLYINNAYHFYSPEPGPPTHFWFYIKYSNRQGVWFKMPQRKDSPVSLHYQRLLSITEFAGQVAVGTVPNDLIVKMYGAEQVQEMIRAGRSPQDDALNEVFNRRERGSKSAFKTQMEYYPWLPRTQQYQPTYDYARLLVAGIARQIARKFPHPADDPEATVVSIKVYRVKPWIIRPSEFAKGIEPTDEAYYLPFYQGEFKRDGTLVNESDSFLYWHIPIFRLPTGQLVDYVNGSPNLPNVPSHAQTDYNHVYPENRVEEEKKP